MVISIRPEPNETFIFRIYPLRERTTSTFPDATSYVPIFTMFTVFYFSGGRVDDEYRIPGRLRRLDSLLSSFYRSSLCARRHVDDENAFRFIVYQSFAAYGRYR